MFADIDLVTHNIDPAQIEKKITDKTRVLLPTHLNGLPAEMEPIMNIASKYQLRVVEDTARSCGAKYKDKRVGAFDVGVFSFGYGKSLYCLSGGMVTSNDLEFASRLRALKSDFSKLSAKSMLLQTIKGIILRRLNMPLFYRASLFPMAKAFEVDRNMKYASLFKIKKPAYDTVVQGLKNDMFNLQAELGVGQLKRIENTNRQRMVNAETLDRELGGIEGIRIPPRPAGMDHINVHYALWVDRKRELKRHLFKYNIDAQDESAEDITRMERFKEFADGDYPAAAKNHGHVILLPTHPNLTENDMLYIAGAVKAFYS